MMTDHVFKTMDGRYLVVTTEMAQGEVGARPHIHDWPHDLFIAKGTVVVTIGSIVKTLSAPETVQFPTGAVHTYYCTSAEGCFTVATHDLALIPEDQRP